MKILFLGDIVGRTTVAYLQKNLWDLRERLGADLVLANGENATDILGLSRADAEALLSSGVDLLTGGNHTLHNFDLYPLLDDSPYLLRPANLPAAAPGKGESVIEVCGVRVLVMNLIGMQNMTHAGNLFESADRILARNAGAYDIAVCDLHAEATAEKIALGYYLDGRVQLVVGTHTHVQTADEKILPGGTAYITDLGMCGPENGVLGADREVILRKLSTSMPVRFKVADGLPVLHGVLVTLDGARATAIERI